MYINSTLLTFLSKILPRDKTYIISFDVYKYLIFISLCSIFGYIFLTLLTYKFGFEHKKKCLSTHYCDIVKSTYLSTFLFIFGGYSNTFDLVTIYGYFIGLIGFTLIAEISFLKISLPTWRTWSKKAWAFILVEVGIIGAVAGYNIQLAYEHNILLPYTLSQVYVFLLIGICIGTSHVDNRIIGNKTNNPGAVYIHLHHWQIFYAMAFFMRFIDPISQFAGGVFIAIFIQGGCQYGFDDILEVNEIKELHIVTDEESSSTEKLVVP